MRLTFSVKQNKGKFGEPDLNWEPVTLDSETDIDRLRDILAGRPFGHSMMTFRGGHRLAAAAQDRTGILIDFDSDTTYSSEPVTRRRIQDALKPLGCSYILTPSKSHMKEKPAQKTKPAQPAVERWHLYIPFAEPAPVTPSLETAVFNLIAKHFGHLDLDPTAFESARYFAPGITTDGMVIADNAMMQPTWLIGNYAWGTEAQDYKKRVADAKRASKGLLPTTPARGRTSPKQQKGGEYWRKRQDVELADGQTVKASEITEKTPCRCINPDHLDSSPSAFVAFNEHGHQFISCSTCNLTWWEKDWMQPYLDHWFFVDDRIHKFHGSETTYWEFHRTKEQFIKAPTPEARAALVSILGDTSLASPKLEAVRIKAGDQPCKPRIDAENCTIYLPASMTPPSTAILPAEGNPLIEEWMGEMFGEHADFIKNWIAIFAYENFKPLPWLVLNGDRAVGKSGFADMLRSLYPRLSKNWNADGGAFNSELDAVLVHIDELQANEQGAAESRKFYRVSKKLSGSTTNQINKKNVPVFDVRNNLSVILTTNDDKPIHLDPFEKPTSTATNQFFVMRITRKPVPNIPKWKRVQASFPGWVHTEGHRRYLAWKASGEEAEVRYCLHCPITDAELAAYDGSRTSAEYLAQDLWNAIDTGSYNGKTVRIDRAKGVLTTLDMQALADAMGYNYKPTTIGDMFRKEGWIEHAKDIRIGKRKTWGAPITPLGIEQWGSTDPVV